MASQRRSVAGHEEREPRATPPIAVYCRKQEHGDAAGATKRRLLATRVLRPPQVIETGRWNEPFRHHACGQPA
jgi:hypothetical protein